MSNKICIVIPMFNASRFIRKCVKSIQMQSFADWTVVIVDDGSTDGSSVIADHLAENDSRIHVIHQKNKGSVEARKQGVLSKLAQSAPYIMFCDADDTIPPDSLDILFSTAVRNSAGIVCGRMTHVWRGIILPTHYQPPCFNITRPRTYTHQQVLDELLVSYYGISNLPVSLCSKLFKREIITTAICYPKIVHFIGDDLCVSIRAVIDADLLVIIPNITYSYRIGGGTSKYQPKMMDDFIALYRMKKQLLYDNPMPQDVILLMDIELLNITKTYFRQCMLYDSGELYRTIKSTLNIEEVQNAAKSVSTKTNMLEAYAKQLLNHDIDAIIDELKHEKIRLKLKKSIKSVLTLFG